MTAAPQHTAPAAETAAKPKTRIARFALPQIDSNSALLPSDKWIIDTAKGFLKTNKSLHKTAGKIIGFSLLGLAALGAGVAGAVLLPAALPVAGVALASAAVTGFSGFKVHKQVKVFKTETLKELREHIGKKYLEYKMAELKAAWQRKADERARAKAAQKAAAAAQQTATPAAPAPTAEPAKPSLVVVPPAAKPDKPAAKPEGGFGSWMLKKAMEKAQKKPQGEAPDAGKPAAPKPPQP